MKKIFEKLKSKPLLREREDNIDNDELELRRQMYDKYEAELRSRELSNSQQYDKAILTLSSAGFAISFTAIKSIKSDQTIECLSLLLCSWWLFFITIVLSLLGFVIGNKAIQRQIKFANDYYIQCFKDATAKTSKWVFINSLLNIFAGLTFLAAIALNIIFFSQTL